MKYQITVAIEIDLHPSDKGEHAFTDLMEAIREGFRLHPRIAAKITSLQLAKCRLIEKKEGEQEHV